MRITINNSKIIVDGTPPSDNVHNDFRICSLANEYIWNAAENNIEVQPNGAIIANQRITKGGELFLNYGNCYNWTQYFVSVLVPNFNTCLSQAADYLHIPQADIQSDHSTH